MKIWSLHLGLYNPAFAQSKVRGHSTQVKIKAPLREQFVPHSEGWADRVAYQRLHNKDLYQKGASDQGGGGTGILNIGQRGGGRRGSGPEKKKSLTSQTHNVISPKRAIYDASLVSQQVHHSQKSRLAHNFCRLAHDLGESIYAFGHGLLMIFFFYWAFLPQPMWCSMIDRAFSIGDSAAARCTWGLFLPLSLINRRGATLKSMYSFLSCMVRTDYLESFTGKVKNTKHNDSWPCAHWDQREENRKGKEEGR